MATMVTLNYSVVFVGGGPVLLHQQCIAGDDDFKADILTSYAP